MLTDAGRDLYGSIVTLLHWAEMHLPPAGQQQLRLRHRPCGKQMHARVVCAACGKKLDPREVEVELTES